MIARYLFATIVALPALTAPGLAQRATEYRTTEAHTPRSIVNEDPLALPSRTAVVPFDPWRGSLTPSFVDRSRSSLFGLGPGDSVGYTYYDLQTNAAMPDRIINWPDNGKPQGAVTSSLVWTASTDAPTPPGRNYSASTRGTYGAQHDGEVWAPMRGSWRRLEDVRTGFVEADRLSDGRLVFAAHSGTAVHVWIEVDAGSSEFFKQDIPGSDGGLWVSLAVTENDEIHLIWTYQSGINQYEIDYSRSLDGGNTFSDPVRLTGSGSVISATMRQTYGANSYAIAARGENVAVWFLTRSIEIMQLRSFDKGETWPAENAVFIYDPPNRRIYHDTEDPEQRLWPDPTFAADTAIGFRTDTVPGPGSSLDLLLDADGYVHGVASIYPTYVTRYYPPGGDTTATTFRRGTIYQATANYADAGIIYLRERDNRYVQSFVPQPGGLDNRQDPLGYPNYYIRRSYHGGWSLYPQLGMDADNNVYLTFSSGISDDLQEARRRPDSAMKSWLNQHVFVTWMRADDTELRWMAPRNLTPNGLDAKYAALADLVDDELHIAYQIDPIVGEMIPDTLAPIAREPNNVEAMFLDRASLSDPTSVELEASGALALSAAPNPTSGDLSISYSISRPGTVSLSLVDALGREARSIIDESSQPTGRYTRSISVDGLAGGVYYLRLVNDGMVTTTRVHVAH